MPTEAIAEKLQPPIIDSTIPAFCKEFIQVNPSANPSVAGYYEYVNGSYVLSTDTEIINDKVYYACQIKITVPFIHSKTYVPAESDSDISYSFNLKIKTAQSNNYIVTATDPDILNNQAIFYIRGDSENRPVFQRFKVGQYYKFQMAYVKTTRDSSTNTTTGVVGFYSTVATGKYTQQPTVEIQQYDIHKINYFSSVCTGVYMNPDVTEKPYQFKFILSKDNNIIEDSGWQMHNFSIDDTVNSVNYVYRDTYTFETDIKPQEEYKVKYCVKTINNYEIQSEEYNVALVYVEDVRQIMELVAKNNFDNAYVTLEFTLNEQKAFAYVQQKWQIDNKFSPMLKVENSKYQYIIKVPNNTEVREAFANGDIILYTINYFFDFSNYPERLWKRINQNYIRVQSQELYDDNTTYYLRETSQYEDKDEKVVTEYDYIPLDFESLIEEKYLKESLSLYTGTPADLENENPWNFAELLDVRNVCDFFPLSLKYLPLSVLIERASDIDDFSSWEKINIINLKNAYELSNFSYKDYSIEQGMFYQYRFAICDRKGYISSYLYSDSVYSDFEDIFLYDGNKQVKIRFNPKVSSFKTTILEQKIDTIGSKYPFFFRNGNVKYREFPLNGLISFNMDDDETNQFLPLDKKIYVSNHNDVLMNKRIFTAFPDDQYFQELGINTLTLRKLNTKTDKDNLYYTTVSAPTSKLDLIQITDNNIGSLIAGFWNNSSYKYYQIISLYNKNLKFIDISDNFSSEQHIDNEHLYFSAQQPWSNLALNKIDLAFLDSSTSSYYEPMERNSRTGIYLSRGGKLYWSETDPKSMADLSLYQDSYGEFMANFVNGNQPGYFYRKIKITDYHIYTLINISNENSPRDETPSYQEIRSNIFATSLTGYTVRVEREYKMALLEWLNSGTIKMFKSPYEGNFIVRLMNVSLTPQDQLGRMIHSFQCQVYEVADFNYNNFTAIGIGNTTDFLDAIGSLYVDNDGAIIEVGEININKENGILVPIINEPSENIPEEVDYIVDTSSANATSRDIRQGKTAYVKGHLIAGSLQQGDEISFGSEV